MSEETARNPHQGHSIRRGAAVGALAGMLVGVLEGASKYWYPNPPVLLHPDVSYVILLMAPLVDALAGGAAGLVLSLFSPLFRTRAGRFAVLTLGGCLALLLILAIARDPSYALMVFEGQYPTPFKVALRIGIILAGVGACIAARRIPPRILNTGLALAFATLFLAVGIYAVKPALHRTRIAATPAAAGLPNVILITLDTVRADHLSLYGYARPTTPNIDKWAQQGVVFDNAISASSWTLPSHASIFTGLLPHQHGADAAVPLDPNWWTIGEILSSRGYQSAGFTSNIGYGGDGWGMGNGMEIYDDDATSVRHNLKTLILGTVLGQRLYAKFVRPEDFDRRDAEQINRAVMHWFHHRSARPYYLFINYFDAHEPYLAPGAYASRFGRVSPWFLNGLESKLEAATDHLVLSRDEKESLITGYDNCLAYLDNSVGELLGGLSRLPGWNNTIVIITADHGEGFGEHGAYSHGSNLYREVLRVPLIILGPGVPAHHRVAHVVRTRDIFATVLQLTGMENPPFERASLQRFWRSGYEPGTGDDFVVSELSPDMIIPPPISLTTPEWQYLHDAQGGEELYHWASDPDEQLNVVHVPDNQPLLKELRTELQQSIAASIPPWPGNEYLDSLGGSDGTLAAAPLRPAAGQPPPAISTSRIPIGTAQAFFPRRSPTLTQRVSLADEELLRSLPYH